MSSRLKETHILDLFEGVVHLTQMLPPLEGAEAQEVIALLLVFGITVYRSHLRLVLVSQSESLLLKRALLNCEYNLMAESVKLRRECQIVKMSVRLLTSLSCTPVVSFSGISWQNSASLSPDHRAV